MNSSALQPRLLVSRSRRPPPPPSTMPSTAPSRRPSSARPGVECPARPASAAMPARATITTGVAMPSLRPLSTLSVCRIRFGTRRSDITAEPRAASVGASAAPISRAYQGLRPNSP